MAKKKNILFIASLVFLILEFILFFLMSFCLALDEATGRWQGILAIPFMLSLPVVSFICLILSLAAFATCQKPYSKIAIIFMCISGIMMVPYWSFPLAKQFGSMWLLPLARDYDSYEYNKRHRRDEIKYNEVVETKEEAINIAKEAVEVKNIDMDKYYVESVTELIRNNQDVWFITFDLKEKLQAEIMIMGGEIFVDVDKQSGETAIRYGE